MIRLQLVDVLFGGIDETVPDYFRSPEDPHQNQEIVVEGTLWIDHDLDQLTLFDEYLANMSELSAGGLGSSALKVGGRIFAMLSSRGDFVVKLPRKRVDELVASGAGDRFDPGHGRLMKEWFAVRPGSALDWLSLADEARDFVAFRPT